MTLTTSPRGRFEPRLASAAVGERKCNIAWTACKCQRQFQATAVPAKEATCRNYMISASQHQQKMHVFHLKLSGKPQDGYPHGMLSRSSSHQLLR